MRISVLLTGLMLLSSILSSTAPAQEARRLGVNTTLRTYEEDIKVSKGIGRGCDPCPLTMAIYKITSG